VVRGEGEVGEKRRGGGGGSSEGGLVCKKEMGRVVG